MNQLLREKTKILKDKYYFQRDVLVKITSINQKENRVVVFRYDTFSLAYMEYDTSHLFLRPAFMINDVAKMLNRQANTLRKYEKQGLTSPAKQYTMTASGVSRRFYTTEDVLELADFFAMRNPVGRPTNRPNLSKIDRYQLNERLKMRLQ